MSRDIMNIGILTPYLEGFYFGTFIDSIHNVVKEEGARLFVIQTSIQKKPCEKSTYDYSLSFNNMDGWIILPQGVESEYLNELMKLDKPVILVNCKIENALCQYVLADNFHCIRQATKHLIDHGHRKIGFVGCFDIADICERHEGYVAALEECNISYDPDLVYNVSDALQTGGHEAGARILKANFPCTAVIASTDYNAFGLMDVLHEAGYNIPNDLAIIGCDNTEFSKCTNPPLSSIRQNISKIAETAAQTLMEGLKSKSTSNGTVFVQSEIILRQSCGCKEDDILAVPTSTVNNDLNIKIIDYLGNVLLNNFIISMDLNRSNFEEIKQMSWLGKTNFNWACVGFWDSKFVQKNLLIEQFYSKDSHAPSLRGYECSVENFPPLELLPDSTFESEDIIWLHLIATESREWGVLALVGPIDRMKLLSNFDTMSNRYDILAFALEREALSARYRLLLNNVGQGFLSFGKDLLVESEYSSECKKIFGQDIENKFFPEIISPDDKNQQIFLQNILFDLLNEEDPKKTKLFLSLLPGEFIIENRHIRIDYRIIDDRSLKANKGMILILTDITDKVKLEDKVKYERNVLKMVVKSMVCYNEFINLIRDYRNFCTHTLRDLLQSNQPHLGILSEISKCVHTFKGNFAQMDMVNIIDKLSQFESEISELKKKAHHLNHSWFQDYISNLNMFRWLDTDLSILKDILGENYFNMDNKIIVSEDKIKEIEKMATFTLSPNEFKKLLPEIRKLRFKPFRELLKTHSEYTLKLSQRLKKPIHDIQIIGGEDIFIAEEKYHDFAKSLVHVFRNAIDHGIEPPDERLQKGKDEFGSIRCEIEFHDNQIYLTVADDGRGIDIEKIRNKLIEKEIYNKTNAAKLTPSELANFVFGNDFSTKDSISDISGRGIGLTAVKSEVDKLDGFIEIQSDENTGTKLKFILPYKDISELEEVSSKNLAEAVLNKTKDFYIEKYNFTLIHSSNLFNRNEQKIELYDLTSSINIKGIINGKFVLSVNEKMAVNMARAFLFEELSDANLRIFAQDILTECINIILGNSIELFGDIEELVATQTPVIVQSKGSFIKYPDCEVWTCKMHFDQGEIMTCFITSTDNNQKLL